MRGKAKIGDILGLADARTRRFHTPELVAERKARSRAQTAVAGYWTIDGDTYFGDGSRIAITRHFWVPEPETHISFVPHNHDFYELIYVYRGGFINRVEDMLIRQDERHLVLLAPRAVHQVRMPHEDGIVFNILMHPSLVERSLLQQLDPGSTACRFFMDNLYLRDTYAPYMIFPCDGEMRALLDDVVLEYYRERCFSEAFISNDIARLLLEFSRMAQESGGAELPGPREEASSELIRYIRRNYATVDLEQLSGQFNYSAGHLSHLIRSECGMSFSSYIRALRLEGAQQYLIHSALPVEHIIPLVGYSDVSHFYRLFRQATGMTPQEYRRANAPGQIG